MTVEDWAQDIAIGEADDVLDKATLQWRKPTAMKITLKRPDKWEHGDNNDWEVYRDGEKVGLLAKAGSYWTPYVTHPRWQAPSRLEGGHPTRDLALQTLESALQFLR